jgi:hypothetical protein
LFEDRKTYCKTWWWNAFNVLATTSMIIPIAITTLNWGAREIIKQTMPLEGHNSWEE